MELQNIKMIVTAGWVISALVIGLASGVSSAGGGITIMVLALLPPLALVLFWNHPEQTMSERINEARRSYVGPGLTPHFIA